MPFTAPAFPRPCSTGCGGTGWSPPDERLLDLGTGTGSLARGFARRGLQVVGLDRSSAMLEQARRLDRAAGVRVAYLAARAESTGLRDGELRGGQRRPVLALVRARRAPLGRCAVCSVRAGG